jgi:type I restriction enzyme R subunit
MDLFFERGKFNEDELEYAFVELFKELAYDYVLGDSIHRQFREVLLCDDLKTYLRSKYNDITDNEIKRAISVLENIPSIPRYDGNREAYRMISEGYDLIRDDISKTALHIDYIDFEKKENNKNIYKVINQYTVEDIHTRRPDLLVFINGIPVVIFEFKTAIEEDKTIFDAWQQIHIRYSRDIPSLLKYSALSIISDGANTRLGTIFTPYKFYYAWNKINEQDSIANGISSLYTMMQGVFSKDRLLSIIRDFIFFPDDSKKEEAIVCRYPQYFAANKMLESLKLHKKPQGDGKGGIYFGATGSGKTYTMLFLSRQLMLREKEVFHNPTIILITDREDLDSQASQLFVTAKKYFHDNNVRSIESRQDLQDTLVNQESGGVYITTIQKFYESTGLLSERSNIICISDEVHRSNTGIGSKLKKTENGVFTSYGYAHYLRESLPNAVYCGFTGTPIDEAIAVFGDVVDSYTMKESSDDGITVRIAYEPRLARVLLSDNDAKDIEKYYKKCAEQGSNPEQIEESKRAMSRMTTILGHPDRIKKLAKDIVSHYDTLCNEKPEIVQKAMIVCSDRTIALKVYKEIVRLRSDWSIARKTDNLDKFACDELDMLVDVPKINLVATRGDNDENELYDICGTKDHHKFLDEQFKNTDSNFKVAIVVDMWITGFDVPSLAVMYIDKKLQKHTLIQTISRVNRVFDGKDKGLIVDYIGIKDEMMEAIKIYGGPQESPVDEIAISLGIFRNHLKIIDDLVINFNATDFYIGEPLHRLNCLNRAVEYVQISKEIEFRFMSLTRKLKAAYNIVFPSGELTDKEVSKAQLYLAIRSIIYKQTIGNAPDAEIMNQIVEEMVKNAISVTGVENIIDEHKSLDIFSDEFLDQIKAVKMPITKFNALIKLLKKAISNYGRVNKVKSIEFDERLRRVIEAYNTRDKLIFTSEVVADFVNDLSDELIKIFQDLNEDKTSFEKMGISYEEKAFYDILVKVRHIHEFIFEDQKCVVLAKKIKDLVDDKLQYADFFNRDDIKNQLNMDLTVLLYKNGYPPEWDEEVFEKVMQQAENFKKYV